MVLGLTSVTLLELTVDMILRLAHDNKLTVIEWSERHLRHGDTAEAARLKKLSENAGLTIAAYHPDFDICGGSDAEFEAILDTAAALGTDTVSLTIASGSGENPDDALDTLAHAVQHLAALAEAQLNALPFLSARLCVGGLHPHHPIYGAGGTQKCVCQLAAKPYIIINL